MGHLQAQPVISVQPANAAAWPGSNVTFTVSAAGTGPLGYHWQFNGTSLPVTTISTAAGNGTAGFLGDSGAATNAELSSPSGLAMNLSGALFIADRANNRIRKLDTNGILTTVAGGGTGGDGGLATDAKLNGPTAVALDAVGNLYIAEMLSSRVRKVDTNGVISTVAGTNSPGYSGDGGAAAIAKLNGPAGVALDAAGNLYIADNSNNRIRKVDTNGIITTFAGTGASGSTGDGGAATNATLYGPSGVALDARGNLFIADSANRRIRRVDTNGIITRVAGVGAGSSLGDGGPATNATLYSPEGVCLDPAGNLYIADTFNQRIRLVDTNGIITTVAGQGGTGLYAGGYSGDGGPATNATLHAPGGVVLDPVGNLYVADTGNNRVRLVALGGYPTLTLTNVGLSNVGNYAVVVNDVGGSVTSSIANFSLLGPPALLTQPNGQAAWVGSNATFAVSATGSTPLAYQWYWNGITPIDGGTDAVLQLNAVGTSQAGGYTVVITNDYGSLTSSVAVLTVNQLLSGPTNQTVLAGTPVTLSVQVGGGGGLQYQWLCNGTNVPNNIIRTIAGGNASTNALGDGGPATNAMLHAPGRIRFDSAGNLFIADCYNNRVRRVDTNGIITTVAGMTNSVDSGDGGLATNASLSGPNAVCWDSIGNLYIGDLYYVRKVDANGIITTAAGNGGTAYPGDGRQATNAAVWNASGVCMDGQDRLYIAEYYLNRLCQVDRNGIMTTVVGNSGSGFAGDGGLAALAKLSSPTDVALDSVGNLYIMDSGNGRVRKIDNTSGMITTVAGSGFGYAGDGGPATAAKLKAQSVTVDVQGNIYIADFGNNRIRKVDTQGIITTVAGTGTPGESGDGGAATNALIVNPNGITLDAAGNLFFSEAPLGYSRIRAVFLAGEPRLTLSNPTLANAGTYQVIITSPSGSVTSQVATLTVQVPPAIQGVVPQPDGTVVLNCTGTPNSTNRVWVSSSLVAPMVWSPLSTNVAAPDGTWQCTDPNANGASARFYRASMP